MPIFIPWHGMYVTKELNELMNPHREGVWMSEEILKMKHRLI